MTFSSRKGYFFDYFYDKRYFSCNLHAGIVTYDSKFNVLYTYKPKYASHISKLLIIDDFLYFFAEKDYLVQKLNFKKNAIKSQYKYIGDIPDKKVRKTLKAYKQLPIKQIQKKEDIKYYEKILGLN